MLRGNREERQSRGYWCGKLGNARSLHVAVLPAEIIANLTHVLAEAAKPRRIILFGSYARGDSSELSDIDIMVVEPNVADRHSEMVRLSRLLRPLGLALDLLVVTEDSYNYWRDTPGNVYFEAASEGKVLYEAA